MAPTLARSVTGVQVVRLLGRAALLAYVLAGGAVLLISYGFVRLSAAYSHAGSVYAFVGKTLGPGAGFLATWTLFGTYIVFPPVSVLGMAAFTQALLRQTGAVTSGDWLPIALVSWALMWALVWRGINVTALSVNAVEDVSVLLVAVLVAII
jgi:amino acid transporter